MKIPVFVSCPTQLNRDQTRARRVVLSLLTDLRLEPRSLGRSDYPKDVPLREVLVIARHCFGGVILGFEQFKATSGAWKPGTKEEHRIPRGHSASFPTPWNQLEAGILFGLRLPLLIFREKEIAGGVFDIGTTEVFVHSMPATRPGEKKRQELKEVFLKWHAEVTKRYYEF